MSKISEIINNRKHYDGSTLSERMDECRTSAISIVVVENYEISEVFTQGVKKRRTTEKVTEDTLFQACSISKPVFATAVMRLAEAGKLNIDTDISEYQDDYEIPTYDNKKHKITLRQILSHHAGLSLHGFAGYQQGQRIPTVEQILNGALPANNMRLKLSESPETGFKYSGGGYILAQKIVTDIFNNDFCDIMDDLVLSPFSMTQSSFLHPLENGRINQIAVGYNHHNLQLKGGYNIMPELAAAGLWTTPSDLSRFGIEIMKALKSESKCLTKYSAELMTTEAYKNSPYGLGLAIDNCKKGVTFGHGGANIGYYTSMRFCPDEGSGIVVMLNSAIGREIRSEVTNAFKETFGW